MIRLSGLTFILCLLAMAGRTQMIDKIVCVVGEDIILQSDVDGQVAYFIANGQRDDGTLECQVMDKLIMEMLLLTRAKQDSIFITDEEVEAQLNRKLDYFIQVYQGSEELEKIYGKPLIEIKADLRPDIKNQLLIERMRQKIVSDVTITPKEVKKFFNQIPTDSLPYLPAEVEIFHIVKEPKPTAEEREKAKKKLEEIRGVIESGQETFEKMARKHSDDFSSAKVGGGLPEFGRGQMVPEFEEMAFKLDIGEMSPVFETDYGYHIMVVNARVGQRVQAKHILVSPQMTLEDDVTAKEELAKIKKMLSGADSLSFEKAAIRFSDDESTKSCGGCVKNPQTGETSIPLDLLDADFYLKVDDMEAGDITEPMEWIRPDGKKMFHILYLKKRTPPHVANLKDDYRKIYDAALQTKQATELDKWFDTARKNIYIEVKSENCQEALTHWIK